MVTDNKNLGFSTKAIHHGHKPEDWPSHPVIPGISLATTFKQKTPGEPYGDNYSRVGNPTRCTLEKSLAALEDAQYALSFSSGLAAINNVSSLVEAGEEVVCMNSIYHGTTNFFTNCFSKLGFVVKLVDCKNIEELKQALNTNTKLVWLETPSNPLLRGLDMELTVNEIKSINQNTVVVVDNTFMSPYFQNPLKYGIDVVVHSVTKYINGHSDVLMGCLMTNRTDLYEKLKFSQYSIGSVPSPFECYLVLRGIKTLALRMEKHQENALKIASFMQSCEKVAKVIYPGLTTHPDHELFKKQSRGFSGMLSFTLKSSLEQCLDFLNALQIISVAESLGGFDTIVKLPRLMNYAEATAEQREKLGIEDTLIRMSVGLEDVKDLIQDLTQAMDKLY